MAKSKAEVDPTVYLDKAATDLQARFAEWITEQVGYDPSKAKTKQEAFEEGVRLATACRMVFQASPENKEANAARVAAREERDEDDERPAKKKAKAEVPVSKKSKKKAEPEPDEDDEAEEEPEAPVKKKAKKGAAAAKRKRRSADSDDDSAPF